MTNGRLQQNTGGTIIIVLVFAGVFVILVGSLLNFILQQSITGRSKINKTNSLQVAEAGLEFYKWYLAHNPNATLNETRDYKDVNGIKLGEYTITDTPKVQCGDIMYRDIRVQGAPVADLNFKRTISARYMLPSVANYSYIINNDVWAGSSRNIVGPYYSVGGIRMDAVHNSTVTSAKSTWTCDSSFGCNPTTNKPGVWGSGSNPQLWQYPKTVINFNNLDVNFSDLRTKAVNYGLFFGSVSGGAGDKGYHIIFKNDGTFDLYKVTSASYNWGWDVGGVAHRDYHTIVSEQFMGNFAVNSNCSVIFLEDQTWVEGVVKGKVTLVVADLAHNYDPDVILHNNITYNTDAREDGLTILGEHDILVSAMSPENLTVNGIFVAVGGKFGRYHYVESPGWYWDYGYGWYRWMNGVGTHQDLGTLTINGTVVSHGRTGTAWGYGVYKWNGWYWQYIYEDSGFSNRINSYERAQAQAPPPFTPSISSVPYIINWHEVK